jgi:hypothetical protein
VTSVLTSIDCLLAVVVVDTGMIARGDRSRIHMVRPLGPQRLHRRFLIDYHLRQQVYAVSIQTRRSA